MIELLNSKQYPPRKIAKLTKEIEKLTIDIATRSQKHHSLEWYEALSELSFYLEDLDYQIKEIDKGRR